MTSPSSEKPSLTREWVKACLMPQFAGTEERRPSALLACRRAAIFACLSPVLGMPTVSERHWLQLHSASGGMLCLHYHTVVSVPTSLCHPDPPLYSHLQPVLGSCLSPYPDLNPGPFLLQGKWLQSLSSCLHLTYSRFCEPFCDCLFGLGSLDIL